jgi:hypothetical protein
VSGQSYEEAVVGAERMGEMLRSTGVAMEDVTAETVAGWMCDTIAALVDERQGGRA